MSGGGGVSMEQHTPGPWSVFYYDAGDADHYDHNGPCPSIQAPDDQDCAIVHWDGFKQKYWSSANGNQKQIEANARLIAAAPELLEALIAAESLFNHTFAMGGTIHKQMRAAIAKALGE